MKNQRAVIVMALAVVFGLAAVALAAQWLLNAPAATTIVSAGTRLPPATTAVARFPSVSMSVTGRS